MTDPAAPSPWIRVRNVALEYVGIGWFLTQVAGVMLRRFGWPAVFGDYLIMALGGGFLVTIAASTVMARRGFGRAPMGRRGRGLVLAGVAALAALVVWAAGGGVGAVQAVPTGLVQESRGLFSTSTDVEGFFVVHPQQPLTPTDIFVNPGQTVSIWADGRVNISVARLVEAATAGDDDAYEWVGAEGEVDALGQPSLRRDRGRPGREQCLVNPAYPYGALLLIIAPSDRITTTAARRMEPDQAIFPTGTHLEVRVGVGGYLTLAVNDVYLDQEACDPEAFASGRDPGAFFRDNIGFFSTRIRVR